MRPDKQTQKREMRKFLGVAITGFLFMVAGIAVLLVPVTQGQFMAAGAAVFGAACAGIGIVQMIALKRGAKPHHVAMAWMAVLFGLGCLLIAVGAFQGADTDFSLRHPRWAGIVFGSLGALAFGGGGIYMLLKGPPK